MGKALSLSPFLKRQSPNPGPQQKPPALAACKRRRPWFDKLTMRAKLLKTRGLILSLSKDEAKISAF
jgi:hypothetical protein